MSLLPQRKKSAEEIAKLRESLGISGLPADAPGAPEMDVASEPTTPAPASGPRQVHSLKKSEWMPPVPAPDHGGAGDEPGERPPSVLPAKTVRSLRKSEQIPVLTVQRDLAPEDSTLPAHRHNDQELGEIRRHAALELIQPVANPKLAKAHPALVIPGYLASLAGAVGFYYYQAPIAVTAACAAVSLLIAAFIFLRKPVSRHHAAFITVAALFVIVSGTLHYFPQLQYAT